MSFQTKKTKSVKCNELKIRKCTRKKLKNLHEPFFKISS